MSQVVKNLSNERAQSFDSVLIAIDCTGITGRESLWLLGSG